MITLFVGDNDIGCRQKAQAYDSQAFLVDNSNWKKIIQNKFDQDITIFTSFADLPKIDSSTAALWDIISIADKIFYCPPYRWSDETGNFTWTSQQCLLEYYLYQAQLLGCSVFGLDISKYRESPYLELVQKRTCNNQCLWVSGCSISHGVGVNIEERYGTIVGCKLNLPTHHLTHFGTSLEWAADQILRSDIRSGDIVIWGLTHETRAPLARNGRIGTLTDNQESIDQRLDETRYYKAITSVYQVINSSRKVGYRLILLPLLCSEKLRMNLIHQDEFHSLPFQTRYLDVGSDNLHPGARQHKAYVDFCLDILNHGR